MLVGGADTLMRRIKENVDRRERRGKQLGRRRRSIEIEEVAPRLYIHTYTYIHNRSSSRTWTPVRGEQELLVTSERGTRRAEVKTTTTCASSKGEERGRARARRGKSVCI